MSHFPNESFTCSNCGLTSPICKLMHHNCDDGLEIQQLRARVLNLEADATRLDRLEKLTKESRTGISFDWCRHTEEGQVLEHGFRFMCHHHLGERRTDIRASIDSIPDNFK